MNTFKYALARQPAASLSQGLTTHHEYGAPRLELTLEQYNAYIHALQHSGLTVTVLPADARFPDGHYVEDTAVIYKEVAFITHPGTKSRAAEVESIAEHLSHLNIVQFEGEEARLEGGDVLFCGNHVLIGLSKRTNRAGAEQLAYALHCIQEDLKIEFIPFSGVLHLKTGLTALTEDLLLHDPHMKTDYHADFAQTITLPPEEGYAANILPLNETVIIPAGYRSVHELAEKHYQKICLVEMSEFQKMDGGLTCLSLRY